MRKTLIFSIVTICVVLLYEAFMLGNNEPGDTISESMWQFFHQFPIFAFILGDIFGMLKGHFWWPLKEGARDGKKD